MMRAVDLERTLRSILRELEPYLSDMVLIGGWVPYLYRWYGGFASWGGADTLTFEVDVLVERPLPAGSRQDLAAVLCGAGFHALGGASPAAVWVRSVEAGEKIEFITEHRGTAHVQGHAVPVTEQPGLAAISLVELEVMRSHTRTLILPAISGAHPVEVRVPTLGAYVVNKGLTFIQRGQRRDESGAPKLAKDLLYLRDLASAGDEVMAAIAEDVESIARASA